jgi:hypothetical protein
MANKNDFFLPVLWQDLLLKHSCGIGFNWFIGIGRVNPV